MVQGEPTLKRAVWLCIGAVTNKIGAAKYWWVMEWQRELELIEMVMAEEEEQEIRAEMEAKKTELTQKMTTAKKTFDETKETVVQV